MNDLIFSIVIPAFNEAVHIKKCIESVKAKGRHHFSSMLKSQEIA